MKTTDEIIDLGAAFWGTTRAELIGRARHEPLARYRSSIMDACRKEGHTLVVVGAGFERDHGTVIASLRHCVEGRMKPFWTKHLEFLEYVRTASAIANHSLETSNSIDRAIRGIDLQITELQSMRIRLEAVRLQMKLLKRIEVHGAE